MLYFHCISSFGVSSLPYLWGTAAHKFIPHDSNLTLFTLNPIAHFRNIKISQYLCVSILFKQLWWNENSKLHFPALHKILILVFSFFPSICWCLLSWLCKTCHAVGIEAFPMEPITFLIFNLLSLTLFSSIWESSVLFLCSVLEKKNNLLWRCKKGQWLGQFYVYSSSWGKTTGILCLISCRTGMCSGLELYCSGMDF